METDQKIDLNSLCLRPLLEAFNQNKDFDKYRNKIENAVAEAYVAFVDISAFSSKIKGRETSQVKEYLECYYEQIIPIVEEFHGQIDKMMGDGIIVVFSDIFGYNFPDGVGENCLAFCKKCVETFEKTDYAVKAAVGSGLLNFCKVGVTESYEEYGCIGHPLTVAFRLEQYAEKNQIWMLASDPLVRSFAVDDFWMGHEEDVFLKGLDEAKAFMCEYNSTVGEACKWM